MLKNRRLVKLRSQLRYPRRPKGSLGIQFKYEEINPSIFTFYGKFSKDLTFFGNIFILFGCIFENFRLFDASTSQQIAEFRIHKILFCARGRLDTNEKDCFAFTYLHGTSPEAIVYQCHAFRCNVPEAVNLFEFIEKQIFTVSTCFGFFFMKFFRFPGRKSFTLFRFGVSSGA